MKTYTPSYIITSKILKLSTQISEELTNTIKISPMLRKKNRLKTLAGTLENKNVPKTDPLKIPNKGVGLCKNS